MEWACSQAGVTRLRAQVAMRFEQPFAGDQPQQEVPYTTNSGGSRLQDKRIAIFSRDLPLVQAVQGPDSAVTEPALDCHALHNVVPARRGTVHRPPRVRPAFPARRRTPRPL